MKVGSDATVVIFDPLLVPSIKGCVYLYNAERDAIIQYTWKIVQGLLVDVDKSEKATIKKTFDAKWKAARKKFTKGKLSLSSDEKEEKRTRTPAPDNAGDRWDSTDNDSFELEDLS